MSVQRLYFGSNVLQDGRVFVVGGEYSGPRIASNFNNTAEIFTPSTEQIADAKEVVALYEAAVAAGNPAVQRPNGEAILAHQYKESLHTLSRAR